MSEMIERVARAICAAADDHLRCTSPDCGCKATGARAKAAIAAMREPAQDMTPAYSRALKNHIEAIPALERAGRVGLRGRGGWLVPDHEKAKTRWQAMIDAAIDAELPRVQMNTLKEHEMHETAPNAQQNQRNDREKPLFSMPPLPW